MSSDRMIQWLETQDVEELARKFLKSKNLENDFDDFLYDEYRDSEIDYGDFMYEMQRDMRMEE